MEKIKKRIVKVLQDTWTYINNEFLISLFELIQRRCKAVIEAEE
jgi:hypothetical protein